jgi:phosphate starvation-inducible PhoH-like protein
MVVTGDLSQIDLPRGAISGLAEAREALASVRDVAVAELTADDIVRHDTVTRIVRAYDAYEAKKREETQGEKHFGNHHHE